MLLLLTAGALWWWYPRLAPRWPGTASDEAIVVLADDPLRTEAALNLWEQKPQASFWILGGPSLQFASWKQLERRGLSHLDSRVRLLMQGDDTVGQLTTLSQRLPAGVGHVTLVTDQAHRDRALLIARLALGDRGIAVAAPPPAALPANPLREDPLRRFRDGLRVQLWRATGWDGRSLGLWLAPFISESISE